MFRIASKEQEKVVSMEQAGPDVVIRLNGVGVLTFQANEGSPTGPELVLYRTQVEEQGVMVRVVG